MADTDDSDKLVIKPLGAGQEVGRSCLLIDFKGKKILLDCGIHPGMSGVDALPFVDLIDCEEIDLLLITHFHLDHCGALPWFLEKTAFRGRCFMTHATKAIYKMLVSDYIKVSQYGGYGRDRLLYTDEDLDKSMSKIEVVDFHEQKEVNGIRFVPYVAGHVLGAAMFMLEVAGVRALYTGDYSRLEDRHLCAAEIPPQRPDILITESTYGTQLHERRDVRERRFTSLVHEIVSRGGRCLIPAFALGRAQELLLILDEYWQQNPQLHDVPIYYASSLAKKCMAVYQTFVSSMNHKIQQQIAINNPFVFKHISSLKSIEQFEDLGACVVLASPGMLQSGLSRELFEAWCPDPKNGCIIAGYCVEGTLAKHILSEPEEVVALSGQKLPMRLQVAYISFSAHTDYRQTSLFIRALKPPHIVLVHGEQNEMNRLKAAIVREYEDDDTVNIEVYKPANTEAVTLHFRGEKTAKIVGKLAVEQPVDGQILSGVLVQRNFNYHLMHPDDLSGYTELSRSSLSQRQSVHYAGSPQLLYYNLNQLASDVLLIELSTSGGASRSKPAADRKPDKHVFSVFGGAVRVTLQPPVVLLEWTANPVNDMYADAALAAIMQAQGNPLPSSKLPALPPISKSTNVPYIVDSTHMRDSLVQGIEQLCGEGAVENADAPPPGAPVDSLLRVNVNDTVATVNCDTLEVQCSDAAMAHALTSLCTRLHHCLVPVAHAAQAKLQPPTHVAAASAV